MSSAENANKRRRTPASNGSGSNSQGRGLGDSDDDGLRGLDLSGGDFALSLSAAPAGRAAHSQVKAGKDVNRLRAWSCSFRSSKDLSAPNEVSPLSRLLELEFAGHFSMLKFLDPASVLALSQLGRLARENYRTGGKAKNSSTRAFYRALECMVRWRSSYHSMQSYDLDRLCAVCVCVCVFVFVC